jgi:hypothetical protein
MAFLTKEGIDGMARADNPESCWKTQGLVAQRARSKAGDRLWGLITGSPSRNDSYPHAIGTQ